MVGYGGEVGLLGKENEGGEKGKGMKKEEDNEGGRLKEEKEKEKEKGMMMLTEAFFFLWSEMSWVNLSHSIYVVLFFMSMITFVEQRKSIHARVQCSLNINLLPKSLDLFHFYFLYISPSFVDRHDNDKGERRTRIN